MHYSIRKKRAALGFKGTLVLFDIIIGAIDFLYINGKF